MHKAIRHSLSAYQYFPLADLQPLQPFSLDPRDANRG